MAGRLRRHGEARKRAEVHHAAARAGGDRLTDRDAAAPRRIDTYRDELLQEVSA